MKQFNDDREACPVQVIVTGFLITERQKRQETQKISKKNKKKTIREQKQMAKKNEEKDEKNAKKNGKNKRVPLDLAKSEPDLVIPI